MQAGDAHQAKFDERDGPGSRSSDILHSAVRGAVGAMAMTGMRALTVDLGIVEQTPPQAIAKQKPRLIRGVPKKRRRGVIELAHWAFGAGGGAAFGGLPSALRQRAWAGPVYGLVVWLGFEAGIAPLLELKQATRLRLVDRIALAVDHLLYGLVLSETRRRPEG